MVDMHHKQFGCADHLGAVYSFNHCQIWNRLCRSRALCKCRSHSRHQRATRDSCKLMQVTPTIALALLDCRRPMKCHLMSCGSCGAFSEISCVPLAQATGQAHGQPEWSKCSLSSHRFKPVHNFLRSHADLRHTPLAPALLVSSCLQPQALAACNDLARTLANYKNTLKLLHTV